MTGVSVGEHVFRFDFTDCLEGLLLAAAEPVLQILGLKMCGDLLSFFFFKDVWLYWLNRWKLQNKESRIAFGAI